MEPPLGDVRRVLDARGAWPLRAIADSDDALLLCIHYSSACSFALIARDDADHQAASDHAYR